MPDTMTIEILEDGTIKVDADQISGPNHVNAEGFVREMAQMAGGTTTLKQKTGHAHSHAHGHHVHEHR